jgi:outer membrane protein assembly factor BamB
VGAFNGKLYAIDAKTGKVVSEFQTESSKSDPLRVLDADGAVRTEVFSPMFNNFMDMIIHLYKMFSVGAILSSPVVDHGTIYFGSADGYLYALH